MRIARPAVNPVLRRELVERWRAQRAVWTLSGYLVVLGLLLYVLYRAGYSVLDNQMRFGFGEVDPAVAGPILGRFLVEGLLFFVLVLVLFVAPGYAAAQLSGERERRTLPLLQVTLLRPVQIVLGKLGASVAWVSLLVVAALPLGAAAFFLGGVGLGQLLRGLAFIVAVGVSVAALGLGISSLTRRTTGAVVLTYAVVLALTGGTLFASAVEFVVRSNTGFGRPQTPLALYANPFVGLADAIHSGTPEGAFFGPLPSPLALIAGALQQTAAFEQRGVMIDGGMVMEARPMPLVDAPFADIEVFEVPVEPVPEPPPPPLPDDVEPVPVEPVPDPMPEPMPEPVPMPVEPELVPPGGMPFDRPDPFFEQPQRRAAWPIVLAVYVLLGLAGIATATLRLRTTQLASRRRAPSTTTTTPAPVP